MSKISNDTFTHSGLENRCNQLLLTGSTVMEFTSKTVAGLQTGACLLGETSDFASAVEGMTFIRKV